MINKVSYGKTKKGLEVNEFILDNGTIEAHILDYGCTITKLFVPCADGTKKDVVLGYDELKDYEENAGYLGACIGRVANRIDKAQFSLGGKEYKLYDNDGENCLHGGKSGFDKKVFASEIKDDKLYLTYTSPDGEENFPGNLHLCVCYSLEGGALNIEYTATTDKDTPVSLTNHSYFNLSNEKTALNHTLWLNSDFITAITPKLIPTGERMPVESTPFDFNVAHKVGQYVDYPHKQLTYAGGYDHNYILKNHGLYEKVATLSSEDTCISMDVLTNTFGIQFYSGNFLDLALGKGGRVHAKRDAICLETQSFPNAVNEVSFPSIILKAGETYHSKTTYKFSLLK